MSEIIISTRQQEYLEALRSGPRTTHDLVLSEMVSASSVGKAMKGLRDLGFVESKTFTGSGRGRIFRHALTGGCEELMKSVTVKPNTTRAGIVDADVECALYLRLAGCTGQELCEEFRKRRPYRTDGAIKNIVNKARRLPAWK